MLARANNEKVATPSAQHLKSYFLYGAVGQRLELR